MRKGSKSVFLRHLVEKAFPEVLRHDVAPLGIKAYIIEGAFLLQKSPAPGCITVGEALRHLVRREVKPCLQAVGCKQVDVVLDNTANATGMKEYTQSLRYGEQNVGESVGQAAPLSQSTLLGKEVTWQQMLKSPKAKRELGHIFSEVLLQEGSKYLEEGQQLIVGGGFIDGQRKDRAVRVRKEGGVLEMSMPEAYVSTHAEGDTLM